MTTEEFRQLAATLRPTEPQLGEIRGRKHAVWDLLFDMGVEIEGDAPAVLRFMAPDVIYDESMPRNVVRFIDTEGNLLRTLVQAEGKWYGA